MLLEAIGIIRIVLKALSKNRRPAVDASETLEDFQVQLRNVPPIRVAGVALSSACVDDDIQGLDTFTAYAKRSGPCRFVSDFGGSDLGFEGCGRCVSECFDCTTGLAFSKPQACSLWMQCLKPYGKLERWWRAS